MPDPVPGSAVISDQRTPPRGVLPRGLQAWMMLAIAAGVLGIIVFTGRPAPTPRSPAVATAPALAPNPDRLREYQDRLRLLDERARRQGLAESPASTLPAVNTADDRPASARPADPLVAERRRRDYDSLFASNVAWSRRPDAQRLATGEPSVARIRGITPDGALSSPPSIDDVATAVVRATARFGLPSAPAPNPTAMPRAPASSAPTDVASPSEGVHSATTDPIRAIGPRHRILAGTVLETVLTNRLDGSVAAPVNCLVTTPIYSPDGQQVLIPAGSRVLGETKPVQTFGEQRLAVAFNRLVLPDGSTHRLDHFIGLNDIGDAGLHDQVNQHYRAMFGASAAIGLITGFAQYVGSTGVTRSAGDRAIVIAGGVGDATSQATAQGLNRFLNRLPTITIREGHRVKVYVTSDLELPAYASSASPSGARRTVAQ
jgi:type IV secretion system protein VirB10